MTRYTQKCRDGEVWSWMGMHLLSSRLTAQWRNQNGLRTAA